MKVEDVVVREEEERSLKDEGGKLESLVCLPACLPPSQTCLFTPKSKRAAASRNGDCIESRAGTRWGHRIDPKSRHRRCRFTSTESFIRFLEGEAPDQTNNG